MVTRQEVEQAVKTSNIDVTGRCILMMLLSESAPDTATIHPRMAPTYTELEKMTGASRSTLVEWMRGLTAAGWVAKTAVAGFPRAGFALSAGDPNASRVGRSKASGETRGARVPAPRASAEGDAACRQPVRDTTASMPTVDTSHADSRYATEPVFEGHLLTKNSPTGSKPSTPPHPTSGLFDTHTPTTAEKRAVRKSNTEPDREDVERICNYLARWIVHNGSKKPAITATWRTEARRLIDIDGRSLEEIADVIRWCQNDPFWRSNILSMPKLRAKYDALRLRMKEEQRQGPQGRLNGGMVRGRHQPYRNPNQDDYNDWNSSQWMSSEREPTR